MVAMIMIGNDLETMTQTANQSVDRAGQFGRNKDATIERRIA